ncbi:MAG: TRAM domain-containing protein [Victivallaceae bacterium]|nr:TRAM domain-containing protein [Victivallaceae bacterium]
MFPEIEFQCEIEKTAFGGDGLTHTPDGRVAFIPDTLPGEKLIARVTAEKKNFVRAEAVRFGTTSPHRCEPDCPYRSECANCRYLHTDYATENGLKAEQLADLLHGTPVEPQTLLAPAAPEPATGYRNKLELHVHKVGGRTLLGYVKADNVTVTDIAECKLAHPEINAELARLRGDKSFLHTLHEGMRVTFRYTMHNGVTVWRNAPARNATWLRERLSIGELAVPPGGFFQVNPGGTELLLAGFQRFLGQVKPSRVIDLYAGCGLFGCAAAKFCSAEIMALELDPALAESCRYNLKNFGRPDAKVETGDAATAPERLGELGGAGTLLAVDPPRTGLDRRLCEALTASRVEHLAYISCNPATWVRDAARLVKGGFLPVELQLVNQFARTAHFELLSFWTKR